MCPLQIKGYNCTAKNEKAIGTEYTCRGRTTMAEETSVGVQRALLVRAQACGVGLPPAKLGLLSFGEVSVQVHPPFLNWVVFCCWVVVLCIFLFRILISLNARFADTFSYCVGCLLTLLMCFFCCVEVFVWYSTIYFCFCHLCFVVLSKKLGSSPTLYMRSFCGVRSRI